MGELNRYEVMVVLWMLA